MANFTSYGLPLNQTARTVSNNFLATAIIAVVCVFPSTRFFTYNALKYGSCCLATLAEMNRLLRK